MGYIEAIVLGLVQGLSEFLPISSSGHLALLQNLFEINEDKVIFFCSTFAYRNSGFDFRCIPQGYLCINKRTISII